MVTLPSRPPPPLFRVVYISSAHGQPERRQLLDMLDAFRRFNAANDITGMLLYKDGGYMQLLEGQEATVLALLGRIEKDPRHEGLAVVLREPIWERQFSNWQMAFRDLDALEALNTPGYSEFLNMPFHAVPFWRQPNKCQELMLVFRAGLT